MAYHLFVSAAQFKNILQLIPRWIDRNIVDSFLKMDMRFCCATGTTQCTNLITGHYRAERLLGTHWSMAAAAHDYRETLRIDQQIRENSNIEQKWARHQLAIEQQEEIEEAA